jgi:pimeloyl-ACP methyl ester carboxylesterase
MGCVPSLAYASANPVSALILLAPVLPAGLGVGPIDLPVDPAAMWLPPPQMIDATFWGEVSAQEAQRYTSLLSAESPQAVLEATRWLCEIDTRHVDAPALIFAVRADPLVPLKGIHALAEAIGATIVTLENTGHGIPLNPVWANVTAQIDPWLRATTTQQRAPTRAES